MAGSEKVGLDALVDMFELQYPDIEFINASVAGGAGSNAKAALAVPARGRQPARHLPGARAVPSSPTTSRPGQLQDLTEFYADNGLNDVFPATLIERLTVDGKIYSVPSNIHRVNVVWANTELLESAGIDPQTPPADIDAWIADLRDAAGRRRRVPARARQRLHAGAALRERADRRPRAVLYSEPLDEHEELGRRRRADARSTTTAICSTS